MAEIIRMRRMSDTMQEGVIVSWLVKEGDSIKSGDPIAEVETDKATMDFDVATNGVLLKIVAQPGTTVPVDGILCVIGSAGENYAELLASASKEAVTKVEALSDQYQEPKIELPKATVPQMEATIVQSEINQPTVSETTGRLKASPLAKKLASETGVVLSGIVGTGENGRIVKRDVENYKPTAHQVAANVSIPTDSFHDESLSQMRKAIARRLSESKFTAPHFYLTREINMDKVVEARASINQFLGSKVSFNDIVLKATAAALRINPKVNSSWLGDKIRYQHNINIGVATAIDDGLIVPVIRNIDQLSISGISTQVKMLSQKAKEKKLAPEEFSGNTFTVSNLGMFGIDEFTAIINSPDACIMAVGAIVQKPIVKDGTIQIGHMMKVTLSCDHRVVDGAIGAQFLKTFAELLEEPVRLLA